MLIILLLLMAIGAVAAVAGVGIALVPARPAFLTIGGGLLSSAAGIGTFTVASAEFVPLWLLG